VSCGPPFSLGKTNALGCGLLPFFCQCRIVRLPPAARAEDLRCCSKSSARTEMALTHTLANVQDAEIEVHLFPSQRQRIPDATPGQQ
jgi:hypothetical protein